MTACVEGEGDSNEDDDEESSDDDFIDESVIPDGGDFHAALDFHRDQEGPPPCPLLIE